MELAFCKLLDYDFHVEQKAFDDYSAKLKTILQGEKKAFKKMHKRSDTYSKASTNDTLSSYETQDLNLQEFFEEDIAEKE